MPLSPTKRWCASSVSMKRHVRDSGSNPDSASAPSWNLPSRSVKHVKQWNVSQSSHGLVERFEDPRLVRVARAAREELVRFVAAVASEVGV